MHQSASQATILKKTIPIVYEDDNICIVNKPYGLPVQGGAHISVCLTDILQQQCSTEIYPVHRLDKETSGLLVTAKTAAAARLCRSLFDSHAVEKNYTALCFGGFNFSEKKRSREGVIDTPVKENGVLKSALSVYRLLDGTPEYSLFSIRLESGRMHQIRIHLAGIGYPIIGDDKHGHFHLNKQVWKKARIKKLQLCADTLVFPIDGKPRRFTIPLPDHIKTAIEILIGKNILDNPVVETI